MSAAAIKEHLQQVINEIEDEEVLKAVLTILESKAKTERAYQLTEEQMQVIQEREEQYLKGEMKSASIDEVENKLCSKYGI